MMYLLWWSFLIPLAFSTPALSTDEEASRLSHVGVIGAGAAGLTTAYLLQQRGYHVTLLEKSDEVGGFAKTEMVEGKAYDMSTMFVPGASIAGPGIEPTLQQMIDASGAKLISAVDFYTLDLPAQALNVIPEPLQQYSDDKIKEQLTKGLFYSFQVFRCAVVDSNTCAACGDVCLDATKQATDFGNDYNIPAYTTLLPYIFDGLGAGPSVTFGLSFASTLSDFFVVEVVDILRNLEVTVDSLPPGVLQHPYLADLLSSDRWYFFEDGFQMFWKELAVKENMHVLKSTTVKSMVREEGIWKVTVSTKKKSSKTGKSSKLVKTQKSHTKKGKENKAKIRDLSEKTITSSNVLIFDQVFVTTAPQDALRFLPNVSEQKKTIADAIPRVPPNDIFLVKASDSTPIIDSDVDNTVVSFWPSGLGQGTDTLTESEEVQPFFWQRRHDQDYFVVGTYTLDSELSTDEVFKVVSTYAYDVLDLNIEEVIAYERYLFPSRPSNQEEWDSKWATLQGKDGMWFNGEAFAGSGVGRITRYTSGLVTLFFPNLE